MPAGFYYKTFMWPAALLDALRALHPPRRRPGHGARRSRDPDRYDKTFAHCDVLVVGAGPAGLAAALAAGPRRRAGHPGRDRTRRSAARCCGPGDERSTASRPRLGGRGARRTGGLRRGARPDPHHRLRLLRPQLSGRCWSASPITCRMPPARRAAPAPVEAARQAGRAGHRRHRAPAGVRRQRPARHHAGRRGRTYRQSLCACARANARWSSPTTTAPTRPRIDLAAGRRRDRRHRRSARRRDGRPAGERARGRGIAVLGRQRGRRDRGRPAGARGARRAAERRRARSVAGAGARHRLRPASPCPAAGTRRCTCSRQSRGKLRFDDGTGCFRARRAGAGDARRPVPATARFGLGDVPGGGHAAGATPPRTAGVTGRAVARRRPAARTKASCRRAGPVAGAGDKPGRPRRASTSSISRTTSPPPTCAGRRARATARSSTSSATPPPAWAPTRARPATSTPSASSPHALGRDMPEVGTTTFRPPYTPVTFGAFAGRDVDGLLDPVRKTADARLARAARRGVRGRRPVEAALVLPAAGRDHARQRSTARSRRCATSIGVLDASTLGKIDIQGRTPASS